MTDAAAPTISGTGHATVVATEEADARQPSRVRRVRARRSRASRRFGYVVAIVLNAGLLYVVHQLLDWGWPAFLTPSFEELLPIVTVSFVVSIVVNAAYIVADPPWFRSLGTVATSVVGLVVAWRTYQVFPFDFSGYPHDWSGLLRVLLIVSIVGGAIGLVVESIRLITWPFRAHDPQP